MPFDLMDMGNIMCVLGKVQPDEVYNLAAQSFVAVSFDQPVVTGEITGLGAARVLDAIRLTNPRSNTIKLHQAKCLEKYNGSFKTRKQCSIHAVPMPWQSFMPTG